MGAAIAAKVRLPAVMLPAAMAAGLMLSGCGSSQPGAAPPPMPPASAATTGTPGPGPETKTAAAGRIVFEEDCVACHGANGQGIHGGTPDFTDVRWQARNTDEQLLAVINDGVRNKMPAFKNSLTEVQRKNALAYIRAMAAK